MPNRKLCLAALVLLLSGPALAQDKILTFGNTSPQQSVHLLNGTSVSIGTTGNLVASCVLATSGAKCADIGAGTVTGGPVPTVSLTASNFSTVPDGTGKYNPTTTFTLTPAVTDGAVCWKHIIAGPTTPSTWAGAVAAPSLNTAVGGIALGAQNTSYTYRLDCYNNYGNAGAEFTIATNNGPIAPPPPAACADQNWVPTLDSYGFTRANSPSTWQQLMGGANFPTFTPASATVPHAAGLTFFGTARGTWAAVQFTTPNTSLTGSIELQPSQIPGTLSTETGDYYVTISKCPGDFRYGIDVPVDSTDSNLCKSMRKLANGLSNGGSEKIGFNLTGISGDGITNNQCGLQKNTTYYLNYVNATPDDGFYTGEHDCPNNTSTCGIQTKVL